MMYLRHVHEKNTSHLCYVQLCHVALFASASSKTPQEKTDAAAIPFKLAVVWVPIFNFFFVFTYCSGLIYWTSHSES